MGWHRTLKGWLCFTLCTTSCFCHLPPQNELVELLQFLRNSSQVLELDSRTTAHHLAKIVENRTRCARDGDCDWVFDTDRVRNLSSVELKNTTSSDDVKRFSVVLAYSMANFMAICKNETGADCSNYEECREKLFYPFDFRIDYLQFKLIRNVVRNIQEVYVPDNENRTKCLTAASVFVESIFLPSLNPGNASWSIIENAVKTIMIHIIKGDCIGDRDLNVFMDYLIDNYGYGDKCERQVFTPRGLGELLQDLKNPPTAQDNSHHDHDHGDHDHDHEDHGHHHHHHGNDHDHHHHGHDHDHDHGHEHNHQEIPKGESLAEHCLEAETILGEFSGNYHKNITKTEFLELCPALVQQAVSSVCRKSMTKKLSRPSTAELYGYSSLAVLIISLTALVGIFLFPLTSKKAYYYVMVGFIGLAFGAMAGDALLHLIPQAVGVHSHSHSHDHHHEGIPPFLWRQLGVIVAIYCLFMFEAVMELISNKDGKPEGHSHCHIPEKFTEQVTLKSVSKTEISAEPDHQQPQKDSFPQEDSSHPKAIFQSKEIFCGLTSLAMVITFGDAFHNFGDGLAIGAAFSAGLNSGLSTSLAIFFHELPQEFGDFVVLLSTGLSFRKALFVNFLSALSCFLGLYIGIQLGENEAARLWIFTIAAGMFLYISLVEMLPELKQSKHGNPIKMLVVKNLGIIAGVGIMMVIAVYEEDIHV